MADENKSYFMIIAIVAIVAIVALVIMVTGKNKAAGTIAVGDGSDAYGQALAQKASDIPSDAIDKSSLKPYEVKYDKNGKLIYEIKNSGELTVGEGWEMVEDPENDQQVIISSSQNGGGQIFFVTHCTCVSQECGSDPSYKSCRWVHLQNGGVWCTGLCQWEGCGSTVSCKPYTVPVTEI